MSDLEVFADLPPDGGDDPAGYQVYLFNDSDGSALGSPHTVLGTDPVTLQVPATQSQRVVVAAWNAAGSYSWTPVLYPYTATAPTLALANSGPLTTDVTLTKTVTDLPQPDQYVRVTFSPVGPGSDMTYDVSLGVTSTVGPLTPGTAYDVVGTVSTGLEATPPTSATQTLSTPALAPIGTNTVTDSSPTNAEIASGTSHRVYQYLTFDVATAGTYAIAGISTSSPFFDDMLSVYPNRYDPSSTSTAITSPTRYYVGGAPLPLGPGVRNDDAGDNNRNLMVVTLAAGRYVAVTEPFSTGRGSASIYVKGPGTVTGTPGGTPDAPVVSAAVPGNQRATVTVTPSGSNQGSAVTSAHVVLTPTSGPAISADGASPVTVSGLTNGVTYTVRAASTNARGTGALSLSSASVTPGAVVPGAPTGLKVKATGVRTASVAFSAPATTGTDPVTGYTVSLTARGTTKLVRTGGPGTVSIGSLDPGVAYTVSVTAASVAGTSPAVSAPLSITKPKVSLKVSKGALVAKVTQSGKAVGKVSVQLRITKAGSHTSKAVTSKKTGTSGKATFHVTAVAGAHYQVKLVLGRFSTSSGKVRLL